MSLGDIFYMIAIVLFSYITFGIVRGYFRAKFDEEGRRIDMQEDKDKESVNK